MNEFMKERECVVGTYNNDYEDLNGQVHSVYEAADTWLVTRIYANVIISKILIPPLAKC